MQYAHLDADQIQREQCKLLAEQNRLLQKILNVLSAGTGPPISGESSLESSAANPGGWQALFPRTELTGD